MVNCCRWFARWQTLAAVTRAKHLRLSRHRECTFCLTTAAEVAGSAAGSSAAHDTHTNHCNDGTLPSAANGFLSHRKKTPLQPARFGQLSSTRKSHQQNDCHTQRCPPIRSHARGRRRVASSTTICHFYSDDHRRYCTTNKPQASSATMRNSVTTAAEQEEQRRGQESAEQAG